MKILLFGKNGQVGWELQRSLRHLGEVIALGREGDGSLVGDLSDLAGLKRTVDAIKPDVVVNAAAYTAVDKAESEQALAHRINAEAVAVLAECTAKNGGWLVHYSTDYVFSGKGELPWTEDDTPAPINFYGLSKLKGELAIQRSGCRHLIFRTSWVYGARGKNFAKTMLGLAAERDCIKVVGDQVGAPTSAELIADITARALDFLSVDPAVSGIYHLASEGEVSWHGYAEHVIETFRKSGALLKVKQVEAIASTEYVTPAQRPLNSRLDTRKLQEVFNVRLPAWQPLVERMLTGMQG